MSFWYKGSVKFTYDACSYITITTSFDTLLEKLFLHIRTEQHTIPKLADTSQTDTEVEIIPYPVAEILSVWSLAGNDKKISCLSSQHDDFL